MRKLIKTIVLALVLSLSLAALGGPVAPSGGSSGAPGAVSAL